MRPGAYAFISHISEEAALARALKAEIGRDFLGYVDVYVSSDTESIAAGENWLTSVERALKRSDIFLMLCSPASIRRAWINFEAGVAWGLGRAVIPVCHADLKPRDLPMPYSLRQGIDIVDPVSLRTLYARIASTLDCQLPEPNFSTMAEHLSTVPLPSTDDTGWELKLDDDRGVWKRLYTALNHPDHKWRSLEWAAAEAGVSEEVAADVLRENEQVTFSKSKTGKPLVGLTSRVRPGEG